MSLQSIIRRVEENDAALTVLTIESSAPAETDLIALAKALEGNTTVTNVQLERKEICDGAGIAFANMLANNKTITQLDLGYNKLAGPFFVALAEALTKNTTLDELKVHRQEKDMGPAVEHILVEFYKKNTTLTRFYVTLHDRLANNTNTKGEVRNKEISKRKLRNESWNDLNPDPEVSAAYRAEQDEKRKAEADAEAALSAPISEKIASTGGPYTLKQLTANKEFLPDDIDSAQLQNSLSDADFEAAFKVDKATFAALPKWKQNGKKKELKLH